MRSEDDPGAKGIQRHGVLHSAVVHQMEARQQAGERRAAGHAGGDVVAEGHALPAQPVQIGGFQEIRAQGGDEIRPPLIDHDKQHILSQRHDTPNQRGAGWSPRATWE